jgi:hypothetical protein
LSKYTYTPLTTLTNESAAVTRINANFAALQAAIEKTLSRDGTSPNTMTASLDMNSQRINNLPEALTNTEPVRLAEFNEAVLGVVPSAAVLAALGYTPANKAGDTFTGPVSLIPSTPTVTPTADGSKVSVQNGTKTASQIYSPFAAGGAIQYDTARFVAEFNSGTTAQNITGVSGYVYANAASGSYPNGKNAVAVYGLGVAAVQGAQVWGANFVASDAATNDTSSFTPNSTTHVYGVEIDVTAQGASTVAGLLMSLQGSGNPTVAIALEIISPNPNKWGYGLVTHDGAVTTGAVFGSLLASGTNIASQKVAFNYFDSGATSRNLTLQASQFGSLDIGTSNGTDVFRLQPGTGGNMNFYAYSDVDTNVNLNLYSQGIGRVIVNGRFNMATAATPATASSSGQIGDVAYDSSNIYICTASNTWKRVAIATF